MGKLFAFFNAFRAGESLANAGLWKTGGMALQIALVAFFMAGNEIMAAFGLSFRFDSATANAFALVVVTAVGIVFDIITTDKVGIVPSKPVE